MTQLIGILNLTPDSFSDGGRHHTPSLAIAHIERMINAGAALIDIGAESTRPNASPLNADEEWQRLYPVLDSIKHHFPQLAFSLDTRHADTVYRALPYAPLWINDVSGGDDPAMIQAVLTSNADYVIMHHCGIPANPNIIIPEHLSVIDSVYEWLHHRINVLQAYGLHKNRIIADVGIGFGKNAMQSISLIQHIAHFKNLGVKLLIGHSEKSFLNHFTHHSAGNRTIATALVTQFLASQHVDFLRVHDIEANQQALCIADTLFHQKLYQ